MPVFCSLSTCVILRCAKVCSGSRQEVARWHTQPQSGWRHLRFPFGDWFLALSDHGTLRGTTGTVDSIKQTPNQIVKPIEIDRLGYISGEATGLRAGPQIRFTMGGQGNNRDLPQRVVLANPGCGS